MPMRYLLFGGVVMRSCSPNNSARRDSFPSCLPLPARRARDAILKSVPRLRVDASRYNFTPSARGGSMDYKTLTYEHTDRVVTLTYNRPEQHNAINQLMNEELQHAWQRFRDDDDAFVLVITGAGDSTFCAGWDLQDAANLAQV